MNTLAGLGAQVYAADMLFATLDPTTRLIRMTGLKNPDMLVTDTVGFIQKLPTNLVAAFRATLEEISEADVLLHVTDVNSESWRKQEAAVLKELSAMGLEEKPVVTIWNKIDQCPDRSEFLKLEASKRSQTVAMSSMTGEGMDEFKVVLEEALASSMMFISMTLPYSDARTTALLSSIHDLGVLEEVSYNDGGIYVRGSVPEFLQRQVQEILDDKESSLLANTADEEYQEEGNECNGDDYSQHVDIGSGESARVGFDTDEGFTDWKQLAKGRHSAIKSYEARRLAEERKESLGGDIHGDGNGSGNSDTSTSSATAERQLSSEDVEELNEMGLDPNGLLDFD